MRKMGEEVLKIMDDFGTFGGFQGRIYGRILGVLCQYLPLALGGRDCGIRIRR